MVSHATRTACSIELPAKVPRHESYMQESLVATVEYTQLRWELGI